jgi:hypothetical protein
MKLKTRPVRPFSATQTVRGCCGELATLIVGAFGGGGELVFAHERYGVIGDGGFVLECPEAWSRPPTRRAAAASRSTTPVVA